MKSLIFSVMLLLGAGGTGYLSCQFISSENAECDLCGRMELKDRISTVVLANGKRIETCCARCALHYRMNHPLDEVSRILVADHESGKKIDASLAVYVEGSDVTSCRAPSEAVPREPGAAYDRMFDRCQPGLLAFRGQAAARVFASAHGGRVLDYETALASVHEH